MRASCASASRIGLASTSNTENRWWQHERRVHDLAELCERHGGGGHPYVAGASFTHAQLDQLRASAQDILASLNG